MTYDGVVHWLCADRPLLESAGRASATQYGIAESDVVTVLYALTSITLSTPDLTSIWFIGQASDMIITVICDQQASNTTAYEITTVRPAGRDEIAMWRSKQP